MYLNLSALTFLFFPLLGILIPFILWKSKKGKIKNINKLGKDLIKLKYLGRYYSFLFRYCCLLFQKWNLLKI
ncbi:DUF4870 domain-containing protein [Polaribacter sp. R77954]|uniref:DUF4870 domain-containing protein n=1 Tax=Polaribacter sp. R77954 TaxID=3093870 RepID=UPI0037C7AFC9